MTITKHLGSLAIIGGLIGSLNFAHAQTTAGAVQSISGPQPARADSIVQLTAESQGLELVPPEAWPRGGTFWLVMGINAVPMPCPPNDTSLPIYQIADGQFLVDATGGQVAGSPQFAGRRMTATAVTDALTQQASAVVNLIDRVQETQFEQEMGISMDDSSSMSPDSLSSMMPDFGTNLWIAQITMLSGNLNGIATNTQADIQYDIMSCTNLLQTDWQPEGLPIFGSETTNWTSFGVAQNGRPILFLRLRSDADDGSGLPIWWQLQYFGTVGIDPNADPMGDGWSNIQKYQNAMNPNVFYTPPTPQGLTATFNADSTATVTWKPSPIPVTGYTVQRDYYTFNVPPYDASQTFNPSASTVSLQDTTSFVSPYYLAGDWGPAIRVAYKIKAHYAGGDSTWSDTIWLESSSPNMSLIEGPQGSVYLAVPNLPPGTTALRLTRIDQWAQSQQGDSSFNTSNDILISASTNGLYPIPAPWTTSPTDAYGYAIYNWFGQTVNADGLPNSQANKLSFGYFSPATGNSTNWVVPPYFDGRAQLKQNLIFLLRAATVDNPFYYAENRDNIQHYITNSAAYAYSGFNNPYAVDLGNAHYIQTDFDVFSPFVNNNIYRNFVFSLSDVDSSGHIATGAGGSYDDLDESGLTLQYPPVYQFQPLATNGAAISALMATNQTQWLCSYPLDSPEMYFDGENVVSTGYLEEIGVTPSMDANYHETMAANARNLFGLPFLSAKIAWGNTSDSTFTLSAGSQVENVDGSFYPEPAQPQFQTVEYDFWNQSPLPGMTNFSTSQTSDLLISSVGNSIGINGYAKLAVLNGYSGVYGYLGQYFDQAYKENTNGIVTANTTGVLSPYGSFFATEPGPAALVTMPDVDTGARGTCTVYCVSAVIDQNHGSNMDLSFNGANATSLANPATEWANNNFDRWATNKSIGGALYTDVEQDDQQIAFCPAYPGTPTPDCNYSNVLANGYAYRAIPCTRDLQDFFRLWVCGIDTNLIAKLPAGSTVTLNWGDVGSPNTGNPTIDIFTAADPDGGIGYLTNETVATAQINPIQCPYIGRLAPGGSIQLNASQFNGWAGSHFIMCGVNYGNGGLNLTIKDGSGNVLAQSTTYLQILDIKQMYERWTVGDNANNAPTNTAYLATENLPPFTPAFRYTQPQDTNTTYILHVHGFNMPTWTKDRYAETEFKRLYWQGYHGRFGEFRWPTTIQGILNANTAFDDSEFNAWKSAKGLLNLLTNLNSQYPGKVYLTAHSHGNVVAGEALRLAGNNQVVNTYIAMQGAVPAHSYDPTAPIRLLNSTGMNRDSGTPNCYAQYYTTGAPCYFNSSVGAGTYVNFFNTNDWALTTLWEPDQDLKPDIGQGYGYDGTHFYQNPIFPLYLLFPVDTYTIFSYCDEARCQALGAQTDVGGAFKVGLTYHEVPLPSVWPPDTFTPSGYSTHVWHSAEFRSDYPQRWQFWNQAMVQMKLK